MKVIPHPEIEIIDLENDVTELIDRIELGQYGFLLLKYDNQILAFTENYRAPMPMTVFLASSRFYDSVIRTANSQDVKYVAPEKTSFEAEFESWWKSLDDNFTPASTDYLTYIQTITKELAHGVMSRFWDNELYCHNDLWQLHITDGTPGTSRLCWYIFFRIEQPISKNESMVGRIEKSDSMWLLEAMVALGYANKTEESEYDRFVMTNAAFELLSEPSWYEKYAGKTAFWVSTVLALIKIAEWIQL